MFFDIVNEFNRKEIENRKLKRSGRKLDEISIASYQYLIQDFPSQLEKIIQFIDKFPEFKDKVIVSTKHFSDEISEIQNINAIPNFEHLCQEIANFKFDYLIIPSIHYAGNNSLKWMNLKDYLNKFDVGLILDYKIYNPSASDDFANNIQIFMNNYEREVLIENSIESILEKSKNWLSDDEIEGLNKVQLINFMQNQFEVFLTGEIDKKEYLIRVSQLIDLYQHFNR